MVMRKLIKHILKEEVSKQQIDKGIDIVINGLKKEFPFVVGWKLHDNYDEYITSIFIDLVVEYEKVKEFYGLEPKMMYNVEYIKNRQVAYVITPFEYDGKFDPYIESQKLGEYVFEMYEYIPDELKLEESHTYGSVRTNYKGLKVDDYIFI
tara:strand:+ start:156 stop:608 length:453 start_codon:yes stop_codon:yes gene_type:complete